MVEIARTPAAVLWLNEAWMELSRGDRFGLLRKLSQGLFAPCAPERSDSQIEENDDYDGRGNKCPVVGSVGIAESSAPKRWREDNHRQKEEDACHFEPENAADAAKWLQESTQTPGKTAGGLRTCLTACCKLVGYTVAGGTTGSLRCGCVRRSGTEALACNTACYPQSDSQHAPDSFRSHFDMMVTVGH